MIIATLFRMIYLFHLFIVFVGVQCKGDLPLLVGINIDPANPGGNPNSSTIAATGAVIVRIEFKDASPAGPIPSSTFAVYDPVVEGFLAANIQTLLILDYMTFEAVPWGKTDNASWAPYVTELGSRAAQISSHYSAYASLVSYEVSSFSC